MRHSWAQPSLSRDFACLSGAIIFILLMISAWSTYATYNHYAARIADDMENEALRVEGVLSKEIEAANYVLAALGRHIALDRQGDPQVLAQILKPFDYGHETYTLFAWINHRMQLAVSSEFGVLDPPLDVSDRDYAVKAAAHPWKLYVGQPIKGRLSERLIIPMALGVNNAAGVFTGVIMAGLDVDNLRLRLARSLQNRKGIHLTLIDKAGQPILRVISNSLPPPPAATPPVSDLSSLPSQAGLIAKGNMLWGTGNYVYYYPSSHYPYALVLDYEARISDVIIRNQVWSRLAQIAMIAVFFLLLLWLIRQRMIRPLLEMTAIAKSVAKGESFRPPAKGGPVEIEDLAAQIEHIAAYIAEDKRIELELRHKMAMLKKNKEQAQTDSAGKTEFLAYAAHQMQEPVQHIMGYAQVMKDQIYGPIENRKYRQYAADIHDACQILLSQTRNLQALAKLETGQILLSENVLPLRTLAAKAVDMLAETTGRQERVRLTVAEPLAFISGDEFRLIQMLFHMLRAAESAALREEPLSLEISCVGDTKERLCLAMTVSCRASGSPDRAELAMLAEKHWPGRLEHPPLSHVLPDEKSDLGLELARVAALCHGGTLVAAHSVTGVLFYAAFLPASRLTSAAAL